MPCIRSKSLDNRDSIKETGKNNGKACGNFGQVDLLSGSEWGEIHILTGTEATANPSS